MAEYIDREKVRDEFYQCVLDGTITSVEDTGKFLRDFPATDVAPLVHSRWEVHPKDTHASLMHLEKLRCTHCWHFFYHDYGDSKNYCPNCGSRMDGE